jgi:PTS system N-acetylgalactosamine-specific IIC component
MMRYVGFAILIRVMVSKELWGFFFVGFALAALIAAIPSLSGSAMILLALIGFGIAYWDFQIQSKMKTAPAAASSTEGDYEDGI